MNSSFKQATSPNKTSPRDLIDFFEPRPFMTPSKSSENMKKFTDEEKAVASSMIDMRTSKHCTEEDKAVADAANTLISLKKAET